MVKVWELNDPNLPEDLHKVKEVFTDNRKHGESLHAYLIRKNIECFCPKCRRERRLKFEEENNTKLI